MTKSKETDVQSLKESSGLHLKDFYIENGKYVFTKEYHLKRGHCCGSQCRHCPFYPLHKKGNTNIFIENG